MKWLLIIAMIFLVACSNTPDIDPAEDIECQTAIDCVPQPTCHPHKCGAKTSVTDETGPDICTQQFECNAAYTAGDCGCVANKCVNNNAERDCSELNDYPSDLE